VTRKETHLHDHTHPTPAGPSDLRAKGRRLTRQRQLIWEALVAEPDAHLSAEEIVEQVQGRIPRVNPSTVYRTLDLLVDEGLVLRTDLGGDRAFYEPAREHAHHHLVCQSCGAVQHLHEEQLGDLRERIRTNTGFALGSGEITLFGTCATCDSK
jgi:Fur family ferric uptake transcriptional regulator